MHYKNCIGQANDSNCQQQLSLVETQVNRALSTPQQLFQSLIKEAFKHKEKVYEMEEEVSRCRRVNNNNGRIK